jgi:hypothetical protein
MDRMSVRAGGPVRVAFLGERHGKASFRVHYDLRIETVDISTRALNSCTFAPDVAEMVVGALANTVDHMKANPCPWGWRP